MEHLQFTWMLAKEHQLNLQRQAERERLIPRRERVRKPAAPHRLRLHLRARRA
jgi:hypothetical protein